MPNKLVASLFLCQCLAMPVLADAADFEFAVINGYRLSDSLENTGTGARTELDDSRSLGFIVSTRRDAVSFYDFLFSRQDASLFDSSTPTARAVRLDHYQLGGTVYYEHESLNPFATGGLGFSRISASDPTLSSETRLSLSFGGGLVLPLADNINLRFEARLYGILLDPNGSILCANGACSATLNSDLYMQLESNLGLAIAF